MARLSDLPEAMARRMAERDFPDYGPTPATGGPPLARQRIAIVSTAGLASRGDRPFARLASDYRTIPGDERDLVISHVSSNFDRTGFQEDVNVMFPLDRLRELAAEGAISGVAERHYSFMGATAVEALLPAARDLASQLKADGVGGVLLAPV